jgi:hypothetical protein
MNLVMQGKQRAGVISNIVRRFGDRNRLEETRISYRILWSGGIPRIWEDNTAIRTMKLCVDIRKITLIQYNVRLITFLLIAESPVSTVLQLANKWFGL